MTTAAETRCAANRAGQADFFDYREPAGYSQPAGFAVFDAPKPIETVRTVRAQSPNIFSGSFFPMLSLRRYHRWLAAAISGCCWLVMMGGASAQLDFRAGSLLDTSAPGESPLPSVVAPAAETLPPPPGPPWTDAPRGANIPVCRVCPDFLYHIGGKARGYYLNDQRVEFTGMEATFAVEGVLEGGLLHRADEWELSLETQLFLNQPFDRNMLVDTAERRSFTGNFVINPFEISQLYIGARRGDLYAALGRFVTPFGRFYFENYRNNFDDSPFIRSEAILFRETGLLMQWDPGIWVLNAALTNGGFQQDTNSSKALVARVGVDQPDYALGASVKYQDGIGSESQKMYNNHAGIDGMIRRGPWTFSGEAIYDEYGRRRRGLLQDITWGRSLYYRDFNNGRKPITGVGYYLNLGYDLPGWSLALNYGEFYPEQLGRARHDATTRRGLIKASRHWTPHFESYAVALIESDLPNVFDNSTRRGIYFMFGSQFVW